MLSRLPSLELPALLGAGAMALALAAAAFAADPIEPEVARGPEAGAGTDVVQLPVELVDDRGEPLRDVTSDSVRVRRGDVPVPASLAGEGSLDRVVTYFDLPLLSTGQILAAASNLSERAADLVRLGEVELVVGDEGSRTVLAPSGDPETVSQAFSGVGTRYGGRDALAGLRRRFLEELEALAGRSRDPDAPQPALPAERLRRIERLTGEALVAEAQLLRRQRERLIRWAADEGALGPERPAVLLLVTGGIDSDPLAFYRAALTAHGLEQQVAERLERPVVLPSLDELGKVLAAYGWLTHPYLAGDLGGEAAAPPSQPDAEPAAPTADETLSRRGLDPSDAGDDQRPALVTPRLGRRDREGREGPTPPPVRPNGDALAVLAEATGGELITDGLQVANLVERLGRRQRLTVASVPGEPERIEIDVPGRPEATVRAPRWAGGTPPRSVAAVRVRRLLDGESRGEGRLPVEAAFRTAPRGLGEGALTVRLGDPGDRPPSPGTSLRATVGIARPEGEPLVFHRDLDLESASSDGLFEIPLTLPDGGESRVAVLVEELPAGRWGSAFASYLETALEEDELELGQLPSPRVVRLIAPDEQFAVGETSFRAVVTTPRAERVDFFLDGRRVGRSRSPFRATVDLGPIPESRRIEAVAYGEGGRELGRDTLVVNRGGGSFRVQIVEPRRGSADGDEPVVGPIDVEAEVTTPGDARVEQVEFYWNASRVATGYAPPYRQRVVIPPDAPAGFVRVVARLVDGGSAEDVLFLNSPGTGERLDVNLVEMYVVVSDQQGRPVSGLEAGDFRVSEEGEARELSTFQGGAELPLTVGLAIDSSASMFVKLPSVAEAAGEFVRETLDPADRAFVVGFGGEPELAQEMTGDGRRLRRAIAGLRPEGQTALWESLVYSLVEIQGAPGKKALIVYTDGADEDEDFSYRTASRFARRVGVPIYFILTNNEIVRTGGKGLGVRRFLKRVEGLAEDVGGRLFIVRHGTDLSRVYEEIGEELRSQYLLGYYSEDLPEETWRRVEVEMAVPGLEARTITGTFR